MSNWIIQRQEEKSLMTPGTTMIFDSIFEDEVESDEEERYGIQRSSNETTSNVPLFRRQQEEEPPVKMEDKPDKKALHQNLSAIMSRIEENRRKNLGDEEDSFPLTLSARQEVNSQQDEDTEHSATEESNMLTPSSNENIPENDEPVTSPHQATASESPKISSDASPDSAEKESKTVSPSTAPQNTTSGPTIETPARKVQQHTAEQPTEDTPATPSIQSFFKFAGNQMFSSLRKTKKKAKKKLCTVKLGTGYELSVPKARMHYLKKRWTGLDVMLPKNRVSVVKRYEKEYKQAKQSSRKNKTHRYLRKGEGTTKSSQKPPYRPQSAPLYRHVWTENGEPQLEKDLPFADANVQKYRKRKRPVTSDTVASRSRRYAVKQEIQEKKEKEALKRSNSASSTIGKGRFKYFRLSKRNSKSSNSVISRKNRRIRPATAEPASMIAANNGRHSKSTSFLRSNTAMGMMRAKTDRSSHGGRPYSRADSRSASAMSVAYPPSEISSINPHNSSYQSHIEIHGGDARSGIVSDSFTSQHPLMAPDQVLPDYEVANSGVSLSDHLNGGNQEPKRSSSQASYHPPLPDNSHLDELERELETYMSANYDDIFASRLLGGPHNPNTIVAPQVNSKKSRFSKMDARLLKRAKKELQLEKEREALIMGKQLSNQMRLQVAMKGGKKRS